MAKKKELNNQKIASEFFSNLLELLAKNTSRSYSIVVLEQLRKDNMKKFPVLKEISFGEKSVSVSAKVNGVEIQGIGKVFSMFLELLGPNILGELILEKLKPNTVKYLEKFGITFVSNL